MRDYAFGNLITSLRTELGFSQFQLGKLLGVSDKAVSKWENGNAKPRMATCCRLADILGVSLNELLSAAGYVRPHEADAPAMEAEAVSQMEKVHNGPERHDRAAEKRIELHLRSGMTASDGVADVADYIRRAALWGHDAIAVTDYCVTHAFPRAFKAAERQHIKFLPGYEGLVLPTKNSSIDESYHVMILVTSREGMTNLNRLISWSYRDTPERSGILCIPREWIDANRSGLLIGSACDGGEVVEAIRRNASDEELQQIASYYDYMEIQPIENEAEYPEAKPELQQMVEKVVRLGEMCGKPVAAVSNARYLDPADAICRAVVRYNAGITKYESQAVYYLRTTEEMLDAFRFLGEDKAREVVIHAPKQIAARVEDNLTLMPQGDGMIYPSPPEAEPNITTAAWDRARALYGDPLPDMVRARVQAELDILGRQGTWAVFEIARRTAGCCREHGYPVVSRGAIDASLVAWLCRITSANPLPPHYRCPQCHHTEFDVDAVQYRVGPDLPAKACPVCGCDLLGDGFDIPVETLFGLDGEREPDIDLNISPNMQERLYAMIRDMFGAEHTLFAGQVATLWRDRAKRYTQQYLDDHHQQMTDDEENRINETISGVKSLLGRHPGGLVIIPADRDVNEFTPVEYLDDDEFGTIAITHYDYSSMYDKLLKMDMLGFGTPTLLQMLSKKACVDLADIPLNDKQVLSLFRSPEAMHVTPQDILCETGTCNVSAFSSSYACDTLWELQPTTVEELIRALGYMHGTDVWEGNAQEYIRAGIATCVDCPAHRDDIFNDMVRAGLPNEQAYAIMRSVFTGRHLTPEMADAMRKAGLPEWYLEFCRKTRYMFPRAHATAYTIAALQIAWFKLHRPRDFYAVYLNFHREQLEPIDMHIDIIHLRRAILALRTDMVETAKATDGYPTSDQLSRLTILETLLEMRCRGVVLEDIWDNTETT